MHLPCNQRYEFFFCLGEVQDSGVRTKDINFTKDMNFIQKKDKDLGLFFIKIKNLSPSFNIARNTNNNRQLNFFYSLFICSTFFITFFLPLSPSKHLLLNKNDCGPSCAQTCIPGAPGATCLLAYRLLLFFNGFYICGKTYIAKYLITNQTIFYIAVFIKK